MNHFKSLRLLILTFVLSGIARGMESLPTIPASDRILTVEQVRNFWINSLLRKPIPPKPSGLYPRQQATWRYQLATRQAAITAIESNQYATEARMAQLSHNSAAWRRRGNEVEANKCDAELRKIELHLAELETLSMQRAAAQAQIDAAERIKQLEATISSLSQCHDHCSSH